jgi:tetratricopeptide (TPR) repeat protein
MLKKSILIVFMILSANIASPYYNEGQAYIIYSQANQLYRDKKFDLAKTKYIELIEQHKGSSYMPYALFMLSFIETDYLKIIDYLNLIKDGYHSFKYWHNAVEKLGDIYYIMGNYRSASEMYQLAKTDKAFYMLGVIFFATSRFEDAIRASDILANQANDKELVYKANLIKVKSYVALKEYDKALAQIMQALKFQEYAFDNGVGLLLYAGKSHFFRGEGGRALYIFSVLRTNYPLSAEASIAAKYLTYLERNSIIEAHPVKWVDVYFSRPAELAYRAEKTDMTFDMFESEAEKTVRQSERLAANIVAGDIMEYIVRVAKVKDLSVANLIASELSGPKHRYPIGIYFREGYYYAEIRGISSVEVAKEQARKITAMGYTDTKVVEVVKVTEYGSK